MQSITYDEFEIGSVLAGRITITEAHFVTSAGLFNDFNPMHMDEPFARRSVLGKRILHAPTTIGLMLGVLGNALAGTGIGDLETTFHFRAPVGIGDTLDYEWEVTDKADKPKYKGGIVTFEGRCRNQDGTQIVDAMNKILISNEIPGGLAVGVALTPPTRAEA